MRRHALLSASMVGAIAIVIAVGGGLGPGLGAHGAVAQTPPWLSGLHPDYAPSGVPDFSQCRPEWSRPGSPGQWTHAGPVALADALWWLDSAHEPDPHAPPHASDGHALVTAYPRFGPPRDDHDVENIAPLVEDLAVRAGTNGQLGGDESRGTGWEHLVTAAQGYVSDRGLDASFEVTERLAPDDGWLTGVADDDGTAVLLLGVWEHQDGSWKRVGGHYATMAGVVAWGSPSDDPGWLAVSDPLADTAAFGGAGRAAPDGDSIHGCRDAPRGHDDAAVVSHDAYELYAVPGLPGDRRALLGYFTPETAGDAAAFAGQNRAQMLADHEASWRRGSVVMALDAALSIVPRLPAAVATATATAESPATATSAAEPTASTATRAAPTTAASPSATTSAVPSATSPGPMSPNPRAYLPWVRR